MGLRNAIAFITFSAVLVGLGFYVYGGTADGFAYLFGQSFLVPLIGMPIAALSAKRSGRPARYDVVLGLAALLLIFINHEEIAATYDAKKFQAEVRAAGPGNLASAIQGSTTGIGAAMRSVQQIALDTNFKVQRLFDELTDPALDEIFSTKQVASRESLLAANAAAKEKRALVARIMPRVDELLGEEKRRVSDIAARLPEMTRKRIASGFMDKRATERAFVERRTNLYDRLFQSMASVTAFLLSREGTFSTNELGQLLFRDQADVDEYNRLLSSMQSQIADEAKLDSEIADAGASISERWMKLAYE
ncbi:hypothetical protein [Mesorhizobium sp. 1B3]|uniref:hypothetical protein n=1 Tax=Mesorhizobium sp. 1B3 TaxID=3243599 RepID=UPI003D968674